MEQNRLGFIPSKPLQPSDGGRIKMIQQTSANATAAPWREMEPGNSHERNVNANLEYLED